ncbi:hypothetical protein Tco_1216401 [Tanacetum coccineum]
MFIYLKGKHNSLTLGLWYSRDYPFELVAYNDSDYAGATQDRKSTTVGCQFLGNRLISWQCKKQTVVATSTTEAEYVVAASCCRQVLWIQNQLLDYGYNFMITMIHIDNNNLLTKGFDAGRHVKRGRDTKIPQSSGPPVKVGDEAVHKELGDRMERAATTASSLEAEQDSDAQTRFETTSKQSNDPPLSRVNTLGSGEDNMKLIELMAHYTTLSELNLNSLSIHQMASLKFCDKHNMVAYLEKLEGSEGFHQIIDFLTASHIKNALTECPNLYASLIEQVWQTAALSTTDDGVRGITATIYRKVKAAPIPHESPLQSVHSLGCDEGSLSLNELTDLCTSLSKKVESLESELKQTKQTYHAALTKLIKRVNKLEQTIKTSQAMRRAKVVISNDEEAKEDPSNQGRSLIEELDLDAGISLVPPHAADQERFDETPISDQPEEQRRREVSTGSGGVSTASRLVSTADISTVSELDSTASVKAKDKGKAIMHESETPKKIKKRVQVQMSVDEELAKKVFEEEQARFNAEQEARFKTEQEQERIDFKTALELQKQLDEREEVVAKVDQAHDIDWSDPAVLRYHTLQNRPFSVAEVRKNMCLYLKYQGGYKMSHFKGMSYEDIRPIFKRVWDQNQAFIPIGSEIEKEVMKRSGFDLQQESSKPVEEEIVQQDDVIAERVVKESSRTAGERRNKSLARKRARETLSCRSAKKQKLEDDTEKEELQVYMNIVPKDESLDDFDRQDVLELYRLVKERFQIASPEGYDLLLWGYLKTLIEPNEEDEIWRKQQDRNLINWKLHNFCRVHVLLIDTGFVIHMMVEKKYPLSQDILSKMFSRKLELDHQSDMGYELISTARRKVSTASTELNTARRLSTAA